MSTDEGVMIFISTFIKTYVKRYELTKNAHLSFRYRGLTKGFPKNGGRNSLLRQVYNGNLKNHPNYLPFLW